MAVGKAIPCFSQIGHSVDEVVTSTNGSTSRPKGLNGNTLCMWMPKCTAIGHPSVRHAWMIFGTEGHRKNTASVAPPCAHLCAPVWCGLLRAVLFCRGDSHVALAREVHPRALGLGDGQPSRGRDGQEAGTLPEEYCSFRGAGGEKYVPASHGRHWSAQRLDGLRIEGGDRGN